MRELELFAYPPSASEYDKYLEKYRAFMPAILSKTAKNHGAFKSLFFKIDNQPVGRSYILRTGEIHPEHGPIMHTGLDSGKRGKCAPSFASAGLRLAFNLKYNKGLKIEDTLLTQTATVSDLEKYKQQQLKKEDLEKQRIALIRQTDEVHAFEKEVFKAMDAPAQTQEDQRRIRDMISLKVEMMAKLKEARRHYNNSKRIISWEDFKTTVTNQAPIFTFGKMPCIWLNKEECEAGKAKTMLCWTLDIIDCAEAVDTTNTYCDFGKAHNLQKQCYEIFRAACSEKKWKRVVPVKLTEQDGYQTATPILTKKPSESEAE